MQRPSAISLAEMEQFVVVAMSGEHMADIGKLLLNVQKDLHSIRQGMSAGAADSQV